MSKKGISQIKGPTEIKIGETAWYEVSRIHRLEDQPKVATARWELSKRENGKWRTLRTKAGTPPKIGAKVPVTITNQKLVGEELLVEAYIYEAEKTAPPGLKVKILPAVEKKITRVELFMADETPITKDTVLKYNQTIRVKVYTQAMQGETVTLLLYEDDVEGGEHHARNERNKVAEKTKALNENGFLWHDFNLLPDFSAIANAMMDGSKDKLHEYYVVVKTAEHKSVSKNANVENPDYVFTQTVSGGKPPEEEKVIEIEEVVIKGKRKTEIGVDPIPPSGNKTVVVENTDIEDLLDAYFAKEEYTKETDESAGNYTYAFKSVNNNIDKDKISAIIKKNVDSSIKADKKYTKHETIKNSLVKTSYAKGETISFATYKLGPQYTRINSAPLEEEVYVVASTMNLDGKEVSINIYEKDEVLKGKFEIIPVLEAKENGAELTTLKATVEKGIAKVKVKLRPKTDEDLKKWKEKLQGVKDGTHTYTFGGNNDTSTDAKKKSVAQVIVGKVKQQLASSNKFAKADDIVNVLNKSSYNKGEQIIFDVYKTVTEQWWLKARATGKLEHSKEFLKEEGKYFQIGKKCECEERIRAFLRVIRIAEGTGEYIKGTKQARDPQLGYTTWFSGGGNNFVLSDDHPRKINCNSKKTLCSSAAGAYQFMSWKYDELNGYEIIFKNGYFQTKVPKVYTESADKAKKYNAKGFNQATQDKLCVIILKDLGVITKLLSNDIRGAISSAAGTWVSLPGGTTGQPTAKMQDTLDYYDEFLKAELAGKSHLHIKPGFLTEFNITCQCQQQEESNGTCPDDCSQCFDYADVWENPEISSDNGGKNNNRYGYNSTRGHKGIDILTGPTYKDVHSIMCGEVVSLVDSFKTNEYRTSSLGNTLMIKSKTKTGEIVFILYCHLDRIYVKKGDKVKHGQKVALSGSTGNASYSGLPNGVRGRGIDKANWHCHIETATRGEGYNNFLSLGSYRVKAEDYMKTKFDQNGNAIK